MADDPVPRLSATGAHLKEIHDHLRQQLTGVLTAVDAYLDGHGDLVQPARTLAQHCLSFCGALHAHHTREDGVFPGLAEQHPQLKPMVDRLVRDHEVVARINEQLTATVERIAAAPVAADVRGLRSELTRLADQLEAHYLYEENEFGSAVDAA